MRIRPVRNKEDIRFEKQRLHDRQDALELAIRKDLKKMRDSVKPANLVKQVLQSILQR